MHFLPNFDPPELPSLGGQKFLTWKQVTPVAYRYAPTNQGAAAHHSASAPWRLPLSMCKRRAIATALTVAEVLAAPRLCAPQHPRQKPNGIGRTVPHATTGTGQESPAKEGLTLVAWLISWCIT